MSNPYHYDQLKLAAKIKSSKMFRNISHTCILSKNEDKAEKEIQTWSKNVLNSAFRWATPKHFQKLEKQMFYAGMEVNRPKFQKILKQKMFDALKF